VGRLIDAVIRLSLLVRGRVPGGTAAAADQAYRAAAGSGTYPYYGHVTRDRGFVALQYWFLYAMNDWRSTFGGVNDHEADWEQVTVFLPEPPDLAARPAWVAFPPMTKSAMTCAAGRMTRTSSAGHAPGGLCGRWFALGAYLPGDYLITVEPPVLRRVFAAARRLGRLFLPWARENEGTAFGIPFIDYHGGRPGRRARRGPRMEPGARRRHDTVAA